MVINAMPETVRFEANGKSYGMTFDLMALAEAEQAYKRQYGEQINVYGIISELTGGSLSALMAAAYGAMRSAGEKMSWDTFARHILPACDMDWWTETVSGGLVALFGSAADDDAAEGDAKN